MLAIRNVKNSDHKMIHQSAPISLENCVKCISIYTLSVLGNSSNLIGSLSRTMTLYSQRKALTVKQNKIAVVNWVFCQSFKVRTF